MLAKGWFLESPCGVYESTKITRGAIMVLKQFKTYVNGLDTWINIKQSVECTRRAQHKTKYYTVMRQ